MLLQYKDEFIFSPEKSACQVLNVSVIDFSDRLLGRKSKETMVLKANGNEKIETVNSRGLVEATYITKEGDAIFYNNEKDIYVPRDSSGQAWQFNDIIEHGYQITVEPFYYGDNVAIKVKSTKTAMLLKEVIEIPTCIKDSFGEGQHQFLFKGATLKQDEGTGKVTGIDKEAFLETWKIIAKNEKTL